MNSSFFVDPTKLIRYYFWEELFEHRVGGCFDKI